MEAALAGEGLTGRGRVLAPDSEGARIEQFSD
jgi:hypothetical protein